MTEEIWKPVVGFESSYEVSNLGRVRSLDRIRTFQCVRKHGKIVTVDRKHKGRDVLPGPHHGGYKTVSFYSEQGRHPTLVHIAVAAAFIGPRPDGCEVLHNDGDPGNCVESNLRYGTRKENEADKEIHGTILRGENSSRSKLNAAAVSQIRSLAGKSTQRDLAKLFGCTFSNISAVQLRKSWRHI